MITQLSKAKRCLFRGKAFSLKNTTNQQKRSLSQFANIASKLLARPAKEQDTVSRSVQEHLLALFFASSFEPEQTRNGSSQGAILQWDYNQHREQARNIPH